MITPDRLARIEQLSYMSKTDLFELKEDVDIAVKKYISKIKYSKKFDTKVLMNGYEKKRKEILNISNTDIEKYNSTDFLIPVNHLRKNKLVSTIPYINSLLNQDWSHIYPRNEKSQDKIFYVYAHVYPYKFLAVNDDMWNEYPFYIGKGCGSRAFDLKRNQGHGKAIQDLLKTNVDKKRIVKILFDNLTENEAFEIESKLIYFFGTVYNHPNGILYNLDVPKTPVFKTHMKKMVKKVPMSVIENPTTHMNNSNLMGVDSNEMV